MDILTRQERSRRMSAVRSKGNRSTEQKFRLALVRRGIDQWTMHPRFVAGVPDFFFPKQKLAIFIDGCFWHGCPICKRPLPRTHKSYWSNKIESNIERALRINRKLRLEGYKVVRIWEHTVRRNEYLVRTLMRLFP